MAQGAEGRTLLVVDDDKSARGVLAEYLKGAGYNVLEAGHAQAALEVFSTRRPDLLITDLKMPGMDGIDLIRKLREQDPSLIGIVMSGYGTVKSAVKAMKTGAFDYLTKPFDFEEVGIVVARALGYGELVTENENLKKELRETRGFDDLLGYSPAMQQVFDLIRKVADTDVTVLLAGESGTGKEMAARSIHRRSRRSKRPLVAVNCGAIPEELLESELFGHEMGAFTGAARARAGRFEMADGGTIFLDEIGDMSPNLQVKLLRALQEQEFEKVGGEKTIKVDVRVIAATNQDLERLVERRQFREDLYYRLNVIQIKMPPLRERADDLPILAEHFLKAAAGSTAGSPPCSLSPAALDALMGYSWPGNVRELKNVIQRACVLKGEGELTPAELTDKVLGRGEGAPSFNFHLPPSGIDFFDIVDRFETDLISQALKRSDGVKNRAARLLGLGRTTLVEKMKKKKIT